MGYLSHPWTILKEALAVETVFPLTPPAVPTAGPANED